MKPTHPHPPPPTPTHLPRPPPTPTAAPDMSRALTDMSRGMVKFAPEMYLLPSRSA